jgi:PKD repeat protein
MLHGKCTPGRLAIFVALLVAITAPAFAAERLCDVSFEDCRAPLLQLINQETVEIDVAFWFMTDNNYLPALQARAAKGVKIRVLVDPRANSAHTGNNVTLDNMQAAGFPMRMRAASTAGIMHFKFMVFAGQNKVQFSGANYDGSEFRPFTPYVNYTDEAIYFTDDPSVVNSFKTLFDNSWTDTVNYGDYANVVPPLTRTYGPPTTIDPELDFLPVPSSQWQNNYGTRSMAAMSAEKVKLDVDMFRITNPQIMDSLIATYNRNIPIRLMVDTDEYRNPARVWHSYNVDRAFMAGIPIKTTLHQGLNHEKALMLYGQGMTIFGSSNWTTPSFNIQAEHNYFTKKAWFFTWFVNQFVRKWNSVSEYTAFVPLGPGNPTNKTPANTATNQPTSVTLTWEGGPWAQKYDVFFGTTSQPPLLASDVITGAPEDPSGPLTLETFKVTGLAPGTKYFWRIVNKTMANLTGPGGTWNFTTTGTAPATGTATVTGVTPNSGTTAGGTAITITGTGFVTGATLNIGFVPATKVVVVNANTITAVTPAHAAGAATVMVVNPDTSRATLASGFTYVSPAISTAPRVNLVHPDSGTPNGGTPVIITGINFQPGVTVSFGGVPATVNSSNTVSINVTTPANATGAVNVVVTNPDTQSTTVANGYTYVAPAGPPTVSGISPSVGASTGGTPVTINGTGFFPGATVRIGGVITTTTAVVSSTAITADTGAHAAGLADVVVTNPDGQTGTLTGGFTYSVGAPAPVSVLPTSGPVSGGTTVTINGSGFQAGATVNLEGTAATVTSVTATVIKFVTPPGTLGPIDITVVNPDTQSGTLANAFTYTQSGPGITSVSPNTGSTAGGDAITISGTNFAAGATVTLGGVAATVGTVTATSISATTPAHAAGAVDVVVTSNNQTTTLTNGFTYLGAAPTITSVVPNTGTTAGGTSITINGTNFLAGATVSMGGTAATVTNVTANAITATTPAHAAGAVNVSVTSNSQTATLTNGFTYTSPQLPAPTISGISPNSGPLAGGTVVTISGTNFQAGATVSIGGVAASVGSVSANSIGATTGAHVAGTVDVVVTNPDTQSATLPLGFTYASGGTSQPPNVSITATPQSGAAPLDVQFDALIQSPDNSITSYLWDFGDGNTSTSAPPLTHTYTSLGTYNATLTVTDGNGLSTKSSPVTVTVPIRTSDIVLYAATATTRIGNWQVAADTTAAGGNAMWNPDAGAAKIAAPLASPTSYFELTFNAQAGLGYHLWVRSRAQANSFNNDSFYVQFDGSVTNTGTAVNRIGTTSGLAVVLQDCTGAALASWGWNDDGWCGLGSPIFFQTSGPQTIRIQQREDGMFIDQIVLSPVTFFTTSPGKLTNDTVILPAN